MTETIGSLIAIIVVLLASTIALAIDNRRLRKLIEPMDRDGDGRPGGSLPRS